MRGREGAAEFAFLYKQVENLGSRAIFGHERKKVQSRVSLSVFSR